MFGFDRRAAKCTFTAALVLLLMYAIFVIRGTLFVLTASLLFAYLLYPMVDFLNRYMPSRSRAPSLAIVYLLLIGVLVTLGTTVGTRAAEEAATLSQRAPALIAQMNRAAPPRPRTDETVSVKDTIQDAVHNYAYTHGNEIVSFVPTVSLEVLKASQNLIYLIIIPILGFFILKDGRTIRDEFLNLIDPGPSREFIDGLMADIHTLLLQFMRAVFGLCAITFVTFSILLSIMGVPYAILLATLAFALEFIPMIGPLLAAAIIIIVSVFTGYEHVFGVIAFLATYRMLQDYIVSPRLMSAGIELHPLLVIVGVFAGEEMAGVRGAFLSVPVIALLRVIFHRIRRAHEQSRITAA
jgi:predicted PurR-regulated permease PerM